MKNLISGLIYNFKNIPKRIKLIIAIIFVLFVVMYWDVLKEFFRFWISGMNWRFIVPILAGFMIWFNRHDLLKSRRRCSLILSSLVLMASCALLVIGQFSSTHILREISIILFFFSVSLLIGGISLTGRLSLIILYTALMTTLFDRFLELIEPYLKLMSAFIGDRFVNAVGLSVLREGCFLRLPFSVIEVADSCSGVNQLITMFALGIPLAVITQKTFIKKILVIFISVIIALVMNWIRIILIIFWNYNSVKEHVHGPYEIYSMPFIFLVGFVILLFINGLFEPSYKADKDRQKKSRVKQALTQGFISFRAIVPLVIIMVVTSCYLRFWSIKPVVLKEDLRSFPRIINKWEGRDIDTFPVQFKHGFADEELIREYESIDGDKFYLYIGYFNQQTNEKEIVDDRYSWVYRGARVEQSSSDHRFWIKDQKVGLKDMKTFSWFNINGKNIVNTKQAKIASLKDSLFRRRNNGSMIILLGHPKMSNDQVRKAMSVCDDFLNENMVFN